MDRSLEVHDDLMATVHAARVTAYRNLNHASTGNVSVRTADGIYISRSGSRCEDLGIQDLVLIAPDQVPRKRPSSEWPFHRAIYAARPDVRAIVHCHSDSATVVATAGVGIAADFHYMTLALTGDLENGIRCAPFEIPGTEALADATVAALGSAKACLLGNHGQVAVGASPREALDNAIMLEALCLVFIKMHPELEPRPIPQDKMVEMLALFANYQRK